MTEPARNPWSAVIRQQLDVRRQTAADTAGMMSRLVPDPDALGTARRVSRETGTRPTQWLSGANDWQRVISDRQERDRLLRGSTTLSRWMNDPANAAVAWDDAENLSAVEGALRFAANDLVRPLAAAPVSLAGRAIAGTGELVQSGSILLAGWTGEEPTAEDLTTGFRPARALIGAGEALIDLGGLIRPEETTIVGDVVDALGQIGGQVGLMIANPVLGTTALFGQGASIQSDQLQAAGVDPASADSALAILAGAGVTGVTERIQLGRLLRVLPSEAQRTLRTRLFRIAGAGAGEAGQETVEGLLQDTITYIASGGNHEFAVGLLREAVVAGSAGAIARGIIEAIVPGRTRAALGGRGDGLDPSAATQDAVDRLDQAARQSRLRERDPVAFRQFVEEAARERGAAPILVPSIEFAQYFQGRADADATDMAVALGMSREQYQTALATGTDLSISAEAWASTIAGTPHHAGLRQHVRARPEDLTPAEAASLANEEIATTLREEAAQLQEAARQTEEQRGRDVRVVDDVRRQLREADVPADVAENYATLWGAFFRVMARRTGSDPLTLYQELTGGGLTIEGPIPEPLRAGLATPLSLLVSRVRTGETAADVDRGLSLLEFLREIGVEDPGGDLRAMGIDEGAPPPGRRRVVREGGLVLDQAALRAVEAGFFPELQAVAEDAQAETPDLVPSLLDALDAELRGGEPRFVGRAGADEQIRAAEAVEDLRRIIERAGIDLDQLTDEQVAAEVERILDEMRRGSEVDETALFQPAPAVDSDAFRRWFGDSKVVDKKGAPLVVYHGTPDARGIEEEGFSTLQERINEIDRTGPYFFSDSRRTAASYADDTRAFDYQNAEPQVFSVYLKVEDPLIVNAAGASFRGISIQAVRAALRNDMARENFDRIVRNMPQEAPEGGLSTDQMASIARRFRFDGVIVRNVRDDYQGEGQASTVYMAFSPTAIKSVSNRGTFDPADPRILFQDSVGRQEARGAIRFPTAGLGDGPVQIALGEKYDLSTFLHESGHFFLEAMRSLSARTTAPEDMRQDWQTIERTLGMEPGAITTTEQHEKWARLTEAYFMEGRAPSIELQSIFERFRAWMLSIYRRLRGLDVQLTDEVRGVMDRMLASQDEIADARRVAEMAPLFAAARDMGMSDEMWREYRRVADRAEDEGVRDVSVVLMTEMQREKKLWWKQERATVERREYDRLSRTPLYRALEWMGNDRWIGDEAPPGLTQGLRLDRAAVVSQWGQPALQRLARGRHAVYGKDGTHPDIAAAMFGFRSGDELILALTDAPPLRRAARQSADVLMRERWGDLLRDGSVEDVALRAAHADAHGQQLQMEMRALADQIGAAPAQITTTQMAREMARRTVARMTVLDAMRPERFLSAERRASVAAFRAFDRGDRAEAFRQKQRQVLAYHMYREASTARHDLQVGQRFIGRVGRRLDRGRIVDPYAEQVRGLLEQFDFRKRTQKDVRRRQSLAEFVQGVRDAGQEHLLDIDPALMADASQRHYTTLSVEEMRGLIDTLRNLSHLNSLKSKLLKAQRRREFDAAVSEIVERVNESVPAGGSSGNYSPGFRERIRERFDWVHAWHTKPEFLFRQLDGLRDGGPVWSSLFKPIADADSEYQRDMAAVTKRLNRIFREFTAAERGGWQLRREHIPELGASFTRAEILTMALNWGNAGNREALARGLKVSEASVEVALRRLSRKEWDMVQQIWDLVDSYWPRVADLQKRMTGITPEKVEVLPVETPHGTYRGGYYPLQYDPRRSYRQHQRETEREVRELYGGNYGRASTRKGHTQERVGSGGQAVKLEFNVLTEHLQNVVKDLTHREAIIDVDRLLQDERVRNAIVRGTSQEQYRLLRPWLQSVARDIVDPMGPVEKLLRRLRMGGSVVNMGWKMTTALVQPLGYLGAFPRLGLKYSAIGLGRTYGRPWELQNQMRFVFERSDMMRSRMRTFDRDVNDALAKLQPGSRIHEVRQSFFIFTGLMDMGTAVPVWLGAYHQAMDGNAGDVPANSEAAAAAHADSVVRMTQSAGSALNLAPVQRGSELRRIFTMFYSYFSVLYNQLANEQLPGVLRGQVGKATVIANMAALWFLPAFLAEFIMKRWGQQDDEDDEEALWRQAGTLAAYPLSGVVLVRDFSNALVSGYGYDLSPVQGALDQARTLMADTRALDADRTTAKAAVIGAGYLFALPSRQVWNTGEYLVDAATGETDGFSLFDMMVRRTDR